jgi:tetratricopeptide (TPR) repeat protein
MFSFFSRSKRQGEDEEYEEVDEEYEEEGEETAELGKGVDDTDASVEVNSDTDKGPGAGEGNYNASPGLVENKATSRSTDDHQLGTAAAAAADPQENALEEPPTTGPLESIDVNHDDYVEKLDELLDEEEGGEKAAHVQPELESITNLIDSSEETEPLRQMDAIRNLLSPDHEAKRGSTTNDDQPNHQEDSSIKRTEPKIDADPGPASGVALEDTKQKGTEPKIEMLASANKRVEASNPSEATNPPKEPKERIDIKSILSAEESNLDMISPPVDLQREATKKDDTLKESHGDHQGKDRETGLSAADHVTKAHRWSLLGGFSKAEDDGEQPETHISGSEPDLQPGAATDGENQQSATKFSILDTIEQIESKNKPHYALVTGNNAVGADHVGGVDGEEKTTAAKITPNDSFLVNDDLLAKTLSIYEEISKEDELLLESFRATEQTSQEEQDDAHTVSPADAEPASVAHLKKSRSHAPREISQESQSLFDILNRDFSSVTPRVTLNIGGMIRQLTAEDVKICFVAFVSCFSPPIKSHFATEYNYTENDFGVKRGRSSRGSDDERSVGSGTRSVASTQEDEEADPERFSRPYVPSKIVTALWTDVIRCRFLGRPDITQAIAKKIEAAGADTFKPALSFVRDTLVLLGVLDVRKMYSREQSRRDNEQILSMEETYFVEASRGRKETMDEVITVHQDIHQEYGEYLIKSAADTTYSTIAEQHEKRWNGVIVDACSADYGNETEASYVVQMLPWNTIRANRFREAASMLAEKKFLNGRLQALGVLEGTTAQVTDSEELVLRYFEKKNAILCFEGIDPDQMMLSTYERTRKDVTRQVEDLDEAEDEGDGDKPYRQRLKKLHIATGKALHLMGVSLGAQGFVEEELDFCKEALLLKRKSAFGPSITISDTLHCVGYSLDSSGRYLEALEFYNQALAIRRTLLGDQDLRVAETLHNKGAILCENGGCDDAVVCLEEALEIRTAHHGEHHETCADTQQWIGNVMREWGKFDEGLRYFRTALKTKKAILGADHDEVANTLQNMAVILDDMGKYKLSLDCYNEALRIYTLQFGREHLRVTDTLQRIAIDYMILEQEEEALDYFKQTIELREKLQADEICGLSDQICIVRSLIYPNEVDIDEVLGRFGDLIECYEEALQLTRILKTEDHNSLGMFLRRLGDLYFETMDYDSAVDSFEEALKCQRALAVTSKLNEEEVCSLLYKKGVVHLYRKEYQLAKPCFESVVYRRRKSKITDVGAEAAALYCLGVAFDSLGAHKLSLSAFTEALNAWKEGNGENDVRCGYSLYWLGKQEFYMKRFDEAVVWYRGALRTFKGNKTNVDYAIVAKNLELLGGTHEQLSDNESALRCYDEGIRLVRWKLGETHDFVIDMLCRSGHIKRALGDSEEAMDLYESAIFAMKNGSRPEDIQLCETIQMLGLLLQSQGDYDRAKELLSESYRLYESVLGQEDLRSAVAVLKLGRVLDLLGSHEAAMQCYRETLRVQRTKLRPDHEDVAETLFCMGSNLASCERHEESIKCYQQALSIQRSSHGDNHLLVARTLNHLAKSYKVLGSFDKSIVCYKEALRIISLSDDSNTDEIAEISYEMAESHEANGNYQAAILKFKDTLNIWSASENQYPQLAVVLQKLGLVHLQAGDNEDAVECLTEALELLEGENEVGDLNVLSSTIAGLAKSFSNIGSFDAAIMFYQKHVDLLKSDESYSGVVSDSLYAMGTIYARVNNLDDATTHFKDCLVVRKKSFGGTDEGVARVLSNMGVVFEKQEEFVSAKDCFAEAVRIHKVNENETEISSSLQDLGRTLTKQGALDDALESYSEALQMLKRIAGSNDPQLASLHFICGTTLYDKGEFDKALSSFEQAVKIRKAKLGSESKEAAEAVCMVGQTLEKLGRYEEAIDCLKEALGVLLLIKGEESLDVGNCHHALGLALGAKGDHMQAVANFVDAVKPRQRYFGDEAIEVSATYFELAECYSNLDKPESALDYAVSALRIRKMVLGAENLEYAESLSQLGDIQLVMLKLPEALNCYVEALKVFSAVEGRGHVTVAECLEKIGSIYMGQDQHNEAIESLKRAMKIYTETIGGLTSQVAAVLLTIGKVEVRKDAAENAIAYFKQSLHISKEIDDDAAVASALYEIGRVLEGREKRGEAMECYKETLRLAQDGASATTRAKTFNRIGGLMADQEDFDDAMKACDKALVFFGKAKGEPPVEMGETYQIVASIHEARGDYDKSLECFEKARQILVSRLGPNDLLVALALNNLAINYARRKDFSKACELCSEALKIRREKLGADHLDTCDTLYNIANIVDEWGKIEEAMKYYTEALESYRCTLGAEDLEVANCFQYIGTLHLKKEEDDQAMRAFVESLRIYQLHKEESPGMAIILLNLGKIYNRSKDYEKAIETLARSLRIQKAERSEDNEMAATCDQIGVAYAGKGLKSEAKKFYQRSLTIYMDDGKQDTVENASVLAHFGSVLSDDEEFDEALKYFHDALQTFKRDIGEESDEVAGILVDIGIIHNKRVDYEEALKLLTSALRIRSTLFGRDDMKVASTLFEIGKVMEEWGDSDEVSSLKVFDCVLV